MGFQDALYKIDVAYASDDAVTFADRSMEAISYYAIEASSELAAERGSYATYDGSLWSQGIFPLDSLDILIEQRGADYIDVNKDKTMDWDSLKAKVATQGMRNSNCNGHSAYSNNCQHHGRLAIDRTDVSKPVCEVESFRRVHRSKPLPR